MKIFGFPRPAAPVEGASNQSAQTTSGSASRDVGAPNASGADQALDHLAARVALSSAVDGNQNDGPPSPPPPPNSGNEGEGGPPDTSSPPPALS
jgi:hypothetical protein